MPDDAAVPLLSAGARRKVLELAVAVLASMPEAEVPASLQRVRNFAPGRRASAGAVPLATAVARDARFRALTATRAREHAPDLAAALDDGEPPAAADPDDLAAMAYLLRPKGWQRLVERVLAIAAPSASAPPTTDPSPDTDRLATELAAARAAVRRTTEEWARARSALEDQLASARREARRQRSDADRARAEARDAMAEATALRTRAEEGIKAADERARRAERDLASANESLKALRRAEREGRSLAASRARLLLDTVVDAASGLRHELALPPVTVLPADMVAGEPDASAEPPGTPARARSQNDPAVLDELLSLPRAHLVVDGYNVTKGSYGTLPLADQRHRLVTGLGALAARTRVEVSCVFDGATQEGRVPAPSVRGVRVLFSAGGESADELIRRLVRAEPRGRVVVVVSSDREVADGVRASGAQPLPSLALARLLERS